MTVVSPESSDLSALTLHPPTFSLQSRIVLGWPDISSGAGSRALKGLLLPQSTSASAAKISWIGFKKDGLKEAKEGKIWTPEEEEEMNGIQLVNLNGTTFISITGFIEPTRSPHLADALVSLFASHKVQQIILTGALNVKQQEGIVFAAYMNGAAIIQGLPTLSVETPLNDHFLGCLVPMLRVHGVPTTLFAVAGKKERKEGKLIPGLKSYDQAIPTIQKQLSALLQVQFSEDLSRSQTIPLDSWPVADEERKDDLLMYM
ncbi:hypothetical protein HDV05_007521 [Chytridiales sp. JEL 0842]|nr:hypothetical protein HDV05_007521 [Chytridiales sp. JEL 0842]